MNNIVGILKTFWNKKELISQINYLIYNVYHISSS